MCWLCWVTCCVRGDALQLINESVAAFSLRTAQASCLRGDARAQAASRRCDAPAAFVGSNNPCEKVMPGRSIAATESLYETKGTALIAAAKIISRSRAGTTLTSMNTHERVTHYGVFRHGGELPPD